MRCMRSKHPREPSSGSTFLPTDGFLAWPGKDPSCPICRKSSDRSTDSMQTQFERKSELTLDAGPWPFSSLVWSSRVADICWVILAGRTYLTCCRKELAAMRFDRGMLLRAVSVAALLPGVAFLGACGGSSSSGGVGGGSAVAIGLTRSSTFVD